VRKRFNYVHERGREGKMIKMSMLREREREGEKRNMFMLMKNHLADVWSLTVGQGMTLKI
jgi:hypothetical protein